MQVLSKKSIWDFDVAWQILIKFTRRHLEPLAFLVLFQRRRTSFLRNSAHIQSSEELLWLLITAMKIISVFFLIKITEAIILFYMPFITDKHHYEAAFVFHLQKNFIARKTDWLFILLFTCSLKFKRLSNSGCKWFAEGDEATIFLSKERCSEDFSRKI